MAVVIPLGNGPDDEPVDAQLARLGQTVRLTKMTIEAAVTVADFHQTTQRAHCTVARVRQSLATTHAELRALKTACRLFAFLAR